MSTTTMELMTVEEFKKAAKEIMRETAEKEAEAIREARKASRKEARRIRKINTTMKTHLPSPFAGHSVRPNPYKCSNIETYVGRHDLVRCSGCHAGRNEGCESGCTPHAHVKSCLWFFE